MTVVRELVTILRYQLDKSGLSEYLRGAGATAKEAAGKAKWFANEVRLGAKDAVEEWRALPPRVSEAEREQQRLNQAAREHGREVKGTAGGYNALASSIRRIVGGYIGFRGALGFARAGEDLALVQARLKNATGSAEEFAMVDKRLAASARQTHTPFAENAEMFLRTKDMLDALGYSASDTLDIVDAVNLTLDASGSKGQKAASFIDQFSKSLSQGKLTGLAFTNMAGTNVRMIKALVDGINEVNPALGATVNNFQELINKGKITTDLMIPALRTQIDKLSKEIVDMPVSREDSMNVLRDSLARVSLEFERQTGIVHKLTKAVEWTADNLKDVLKTLTLIGTSWALMRARAGVMALRASLYAAAVAAGGLRRAGMLVLAPFLRMAALLAGIYLLGEDIATWWRGGHSLLGELIGEKEVFQGTFDFIESAIESIKSSLGEVDVSTGQWLRKWGAIALAAYALWRILGPVRRLMWSIAAVILPLIAKELHLIATTPLGRFLSIWLGAVLALKWMYDNTDKIAEKIRSAFGGALGQIEDQLDALKDKFANLVPDWIKNNWKLAPDIPGDLLDHINRNSGAAIQGSKQSYSNTDNRRTEINIHGVRENPASIGRAAKEGVERAYGSEVPNIPPGWTPNVEAMP